MKKSVLLTGVMAVVCLTTTALAQLNPTVTGDTLLCPNEASTLSTQSFDTYQWLRRDYGTTTTTAIAGETNQTLVVNTMDYAPSYISVRVTSGATVDTSEEVLVDGLLFLLPAVSTTGDYTTGQNGEVLLCDGDTVYFELLTPYNTNITWYVSGTPIADQDSNVLVVTSAGDYTVQGAPEECPSYIQQLGVTLTVDVVDCALRLDENNTFGTLLYPNPANGFVTVEGNEQILGVSITNAAGKLIISDTKAAKVKTFETEELAPGVYFMKVVYENGSETRQFTVK